MSELEKAIQTIESALAAASSQIPHSGKLNDMARNEVENAKKALAELEKADYFDDITSRARKSAIKAANKFPQPNYISLKIAEEAGEVVRGCVHYAEGRMEWEEVEGEIVQLIAMLYRLVTEGDEVNGIIPPERTE